MNIKAVASQLIVSSSRPTEMEPERQTIKKVYSQQEVSGKVEANNDTDSMYNLQTRMDVGK